MLLTNREELLWAFNSKKNENKTIWTPPKKKKKNCFFFVFHLVFDIRSGFSINLNDALLSLVIMRVALLTRTFSFRSSNSRRLIKDKIVLPVRRNHGRRRIVV